MCRIFVLYYIIVGNVWDFFDPFPGPAPLKEQGECVYWSNAIWKFGDRDLEGVIDFCPVAKLVLLIAIW